MIIASLSITARLSESHSLKDKRQVVRSLLAGARAKFGVSAAEVGAVDQWQTIELGFAIVSASSAVARSILQSLENYIVESRPDLLILDCISDLHVFEGKDYAEDM